MEEQKKDKRKGIVGTIIFHSILLLAMVLFGLSTPLPLPDEEGVEVNLGYSDVGMGDIQQQVPAESTPPPPVEEEVQEEVVEETVQEEIPDEQIVEEIPEEDILTEDTEEAPAIEDPEEKEDLEEVKDEEIKPEEPKEIPEEKPVEEKKKEDEVVEKTPEVVEEKEPEPVVNTKALYPGKSDKNQEGSQEGNTYQPGDQGKETGTVDGEGYDGLGGEGDGISYSLGGRGAKHLPKPVYTQQEQGKVVVAIWVNREGKVVQAQAGVKGTTVTDQSLWKVAKDAAMRATFTSKADAPDRQKGTITYNFIRLN